MSVSDKCKQALADWMVSNSNTLANHPRRDFSPDIYTNWYISGKKKTAWKRRAAGTYNGQKYRAFTRSGDADMQSIPVQELKASPEKFWIVWLNADETIDRIEWMNDNQLAAIGGKASKPPSWSSDWYW